MLEIHGTVLAVAFPFHSTLVEWMHQFHMPFQDNYFLWKTIGLTGMVIFGSRTFVQWIHSERHGEVIIPVIFWWLSVVGTLVCLAYALRQKDSVFILMYLCNMIPYVRNLMLIQRKKNEQNQREKAAGEPGAGYGVRSLTPVS